MKKLMILFLIIAFTLYVPKTGYADDIIENEPVTGVFSDVQSVSGVPSINAGSAIVMDAETGRVLYEKDAWYKRPMASTTKIMTAILVVEYGNLEETVTVSKHAAGIRGSSIHLQTGQKIKLGDLLYGILLNSGNDAAIAAAEHISGSEEDFIELMNDKAYEIGAYDTCFKSPHGLDMSGHYSTAYDMALIARYSLKNPLFSGIVAMKEIVAGGISLHNTNEMLQLYPYADGVKTGYTGQAGRCLVTSATKEGWKIISVVLYCPSRNARAASSRAILDYAFNNYSNFVLLKKGNSEAVLAVDRGTEDKVSVEAEDDIELPLSDDEIRGMQKRVILPEELLAPVEKGQRAGYVEFLLNGETFARSDLLVSESIRRKGFFDYFSDIIRAWAASIKFGMF
jgi:serine-type D-Ala-D-Ala carboxypeptidase (penicillin-binding protein 5/6)